MRADATLRELNRLVGAWRTEATHPARPGLVVHGSATFAWLEGERFLLQRARTDHPDFPDSLMILGFMESDRVDGGQGAVANHDAQLSMHYYDSRGVFRSCAASIDANAWRWSRMAPGFSQRFTGTFADDGATILGLCELCQDDVHWHDDLRITYRR